MIVFSLGFLFQAVLVLGSLSMYIYFWKNKEKHRNAKAVLAGSALVFIVSLYFFALSSLDFIHLLSGNTETAKGECIWTHYDGGKNAWVEFTVNGLALQTGTNDFPEIEEGKFSCEAKYLPYTKKVIDIEVIDGFDQ